jgi:acid phosphatase (class A)
MNTWTAKCWVTVSSPRRTGLALALWPMDGRGRLEPARPSPCGAARARGTVRGLVVASALAGVCAIQGCAGGAASRAATEAQSRPATIPEVGHHARAGYLAADAVPNSLALLPPPPSAGSAAFALDEDVSRKSLALRDTPRGALATEDADLAFPHVAGTFSCALDTSITQQDTPRLYTLLERSLVDAFHSTNAAKDHYLRVRPYLVNNAPLCAPAGSVGSYPSGHATAGWAWALILSEIAPERIDAVLARGRAFGQSRLICNAHWQSDVDEGRFMGASTVARLQADPNFRADVEAAKAEIVAVRGKGLKPQRNCAAEAEAMALQPLPLR